MKRYFSLFFSLAILFALIGFHTLDAEVVRIYHSSRQAEFPSIITMQNGDLMLVFGDGTHFNGDHTLFYMIYSQATGKWSNAQQAVPRRNSSAYAQLAIDRDGDIHMAYMDGNSGGNRDIYYAMFSNAQQKWGPSFLAYDSYGVNSSWPRIQVEDDQIYIAWSHNYGDPGLDMDICMIVNTKGGAWPVDKRARKTISNTPPAVSIHTDFVVKDKKAYALWMDTTGADGIVRNGNWKMRYNEAAYSPAAQDWPFGSSSTLFANADNEYYPALTIDPSGTVHGMYSFKNGPYLHIMKKPGGGWSAPRSVSPNGTHQNVFAYLRYHDGLLHTCFRESASDGETLVYYRGLTDGTWSAPFVVASKRLEIGYPWLTVDRKGDVHVVWSEGPNDESRSIFYSKIELPGNPPTAVIDADKTRGLIPLTVRFDASRTTHPDGTIRSYSWDFGDGNTATGRTVTHTYTTKGVYAASLKVLDTAFRVGSAEIEINASTGEPIAVLKASETRGLVPFPVTFDGSGSYDEDGQVVSYNWNFGDGNTATGMIVTHTYTKGGKFAAGLTVTDNEGKSNKESVNIEVFHKPTARFTATPTLGVTPLKVAFDASGSTDEDGNIATYEWIFGDGSSGQGPAVTYTYATGGAFAVRLTVIDNDGFADTVYGTVDALDRPAAPTQVAVKTDLNKTLLHKEYINRVSWQNNPKNAGLIAVVQYRIYRKAMGDASGAFVKVGEAAASQLHFDDRKLSSPQAAAGYIYAVTAVDGKGGESALSSAASPGGMR